MDKACTKESIKYEQKKNLLKDHWEKYFNYCNRVGNTNDYCSGSMEMIIESLKIYPIKCIKYNNSLDEFVQLNYSFDSFITVSNDGTKLIISNKKPTSEAKEYI